MILLDELITAIESCQKVINKCQLVDIDASVSHVADLSEANNDSLSFLAKANYLPKLAQTKAGVVLVSERFTKDLPALPNTVIILVKDAYLAYASVSALFEHVQTGIHPTAIIAPTAKIGKNPTIGAYAVIGEFVQVGDNCQIGSHVSIAHHCEIGNEVQIHAHASIGSDGFGFAPKIGTEGLAWQKIHQLGRVIIGHRVRIGSNTCIDRGAVGDTVIGDDVIIDNLVQIAHNVHIGRGTAIAAMTGIAGSTHIGEGCIIGGAVGIAGHITIADNVTLTGMTMVTGSIKESGTYSSGTPVMTSHDWRRAAVKFRQSGQK